jgi:hypothetical protein
MEDPRGKTDVCRDDALGREGGCRRQDPVCPGGRNFCRYHTDRFQVIETETTPDLHCGNPAGVNLQLVKAGAIHSNPRLARSRI